MRLTPLTITAAKKFVSDKHRHHKSLVGALFALGAEHEGRLAAVVVVGRPKAWRLQDGATAEVVRLASDGTRNACSFLYAAAHRAATALGYSKLITYTLASEPGSSLRAVGWKPVKAVKGRSWSTPARPRTDKHPTTDKIRWEARSPSTPGGE